jgi:dihydroneopterin aldolase/D-erythro-7,8-dihydroneopterin triphosphate epimerase
MDRIHIRDLQARCIIGVYPEERREKQDVLINIILEADLRKAGRTDRVEDTVDYKAIKKRLLAMIESSQFLLIEALAQRIADLCLEHPLVEMAQVTVDKPAALRFARSVAVEVTRRRE